jgi:hypothetical protein
MGLLTQIFRLSEPSHGSPPILFSEFSQSGTHGTKPRHRPDNGVLERHCQESSLRYQVESRL